MILYTSYIKLRQVNREVHIEHQQVMEDSSKCA